MRQLHPAGKATRGLGPAIVEPLQVLAADRAQEHCLRLGLDSLRERVHAQLLGHCHDGGDDLARLHVVVLHEGHVELDFVELEHPEGVERRVGAAEIVH